MSDKEAFDTLVSHKYFQPHITPIQIFNRATDPMLPNVKNHTHEILNLMDNHKLTNNVLIITRWKVSKEDCVKFNKLKNIKLTILVTYSGISDKRLEPVKSSIAEESLLTLYKYAKSYKVILYWRPIIPGVNDSPEHIKKIKMLSKSAHSIVFSGLFYREEIAKYYEENKLPIPYKETTRRKILPENTEKKILQELLSNENEIPIFRKTSCGVAYAHKTSDYNGHYGIEELCDICPKDQVVRCKKVWDKPDIGKLKILCDDLGATQPPMLTERAIIVSGLDEQKRYYIQHTLGFQVHDVDKPHYYRQHGRADTGWRAENDSK